MHRRVLALAVALILPSVAVAQAEKTLSIKAGSTDTQVLDLRSDGQVNITAEGNVVADCKPLASDPTKCEDIVVGPAGPPPIVTLTGSTLAIPDGMGRYPVGSTYTLQPRVVAPSTAEVCVRLNGATTPLTAWSGAVTTNLSADVPFTLDAGNSTYEFQYRCFNEFGATSSMPVVTVTTQPATSAGDIQPSPEFQCDDPARVAAIAASRPGFFRQASPTLYFDPERQPGTFGRGIYLSDFPTGGGGCTLGLCPTPSSGVFVNQYVTVGFRTPPNPWSGSRMLLSEFQNGGPAIDAYLDRNFVTISTCPGDFRMPTSASSPNPTVDPTFGYGCRSFRPAAASGPLSASQFIVYRQDGVTQYLGTPFFRHECGLQPGRVYYMNIIAVDPTAKSSNPPQATDAEGVQAGENACNGQPCAMRSQWY